MIGETQEQMLSRLVAQRQELLEDNAKLRAEVERLEKALREIPKHVAALEGVLCEPDGTCCISGSSEDRRVVNRSLDALDNIAALAAPPPTLPCQHDYRITDITGVPRCIKCNHPANHKEVEAMVAEARAALAAQPAPEKPAKEKKA